MTVPPHDPELVLVDAADRPVGRAGRAACHAGGGLLHRAFTVVVLDTGGRLLLARRAAGKPLWPGHWDGTVASHPAPGERPLAAARRRLTAELGVDPSAPVALTLPFRFRYRAPYADVGSEHEVCAAVVAVIEPGPLDPDSREVSATQWVTPADLGRMLEDEGEVAALCPWFLLALGLLDERAAAEDPAVSSALGGWIDLLPAARLEALLAPHRLDGWHLC